MMPQRQQEHLEIDRRHAFGAAAGANKERLRAIRGAFQHPRDFRRVIAPPDLEERRAAQLAAEQRIGAAADDAKRESVSGGKFQNESVGEHAANGARFDVVALRSAARAAQSVPISEELQAWREFQTLFPCRSGRFVSN